MRRVVGVLLMLIALLALTTGAALAILLGPDNRAETGPHRIATDAPVVVTDPGVFDWAGPTITVSVGVRDGQEVFVGAANAVDVADYVRLTERTEITDVGLAWDVSTEDVDGTPQLPAAPGEVDWWVAQESGSGRASLSVKLPEQSFALVVAAVGGGSLDGLEVTASYDVAGGFGIGLGLIGFAAGLGLFGWIAFQGRPMTRAERAPAGDAVDDTAEAAAEDAAGEDAYREAAGETATSGRGEAAAEDATTGSRGGDAVAPARAESEDGRSGSG